MSYSRWSYSYWYTFHAGGHGGEPENRDNAIFEICTVTEFTAKELRDNLNGCLKKVQLLCEADKLRDPMPSGADIVELGHYMHEFLEDIDRMYPVSHTSNPADEVREFIRSVIASLKATFTIDQYRAAVLIQSDSDSFCSEYVAKRQLESLGLCSQNPDGTWTKEVVG